MIKLKKGIGLRLLRYVFGCYLIVTLLVTGIQLVSEYRNVKRDVFGQIYSLERSFKDSFMNSIWVFDLHQLKITLFGVTKIDIVTGIKIENERHEELASVGEVLSKDSQVFSRKQLTQPGMKEIELSQKGSKVRQTVFEYTFALEYQEEKDGPVNLIGYGHIYTDVNTIIDRVKYSFVLIIINSLIKTAALWLFFLFFVNRFVAVPLNALTNAASALNPDKIETLGHSKVLDNVVKSKHEDELYYLATNFDQMRVAIIDRMAIIESQKRKLEEQVLERTSSLLTANKELKHLALHDALTSLPNRALFQDRLAQFITTAYRNSSRFIVVSIDLTEFKHINDNYGHQIGDLVLIEVANRLVKALRETDTVARIGGDEFYALLALDSVNSDEEAIVRKFITVLEAPVICDDVNVQSLIINANVGAAIYPEHGRDAAILVKNADTAMYSAKKSRVDYALYSAKDNLRVQRQSQLAQDFKSAIEKQQLFLLYQPILDIQSGRINKIEALVRWQHPTLGIISPVEFIPICEGNGSIHELTKWVFQQACHECRDYCESDSLLSISINLSGKVFNQPDLPSQLESMCRTSKILTTSINLEITESTAMEKPDEAIAILNQLTERGFTISIDDFGTGYSSFSYLTMLPVNELKIDKSFLLHMGKNSDKVIRAMIELAHSLNLKVVGEGVETEKLLTLLKSMGCDYAQGYYIAKPLSVDEMHKFCSAVNNEKTEYNTARNSL